MSILVVHLSTGCLVLLCIAPSSGQLEGALSWEILMHCGATTGYTMLIHLAKKRLATLSMVQTVCLVNLHPNICFCMLNSWFRMTLEIGNYQGNHPYKD